MNRILKKKVSILYKYYYRCKIKDNLEVAFCDFINYFAITDPNFFRWLFEDWDILDFGYNLTKKQYVTYKNFLSSLESRMIV